MEISGKIHFLLFKKLSKNLFVCPSEYPLDVDVKRGSLRVLEERGENKEMKMQEDYPH